MINTTAEPGRSSRSPFCALENLDKRQHAILPDFQELDEFGYGLPLALLGGGDCCVGESAVVGVDAFGYAFVFGDGCLCSRRASLRT